MKITRNFFFVVVFTFPLVFFFLFTRCGVNKPVSYRPLIASDQFVFMEYYLTQEGEVISGIPPKGMRIDGPAYRFNKDTKQLDIRRNDGLLIDSIRFLLGNGKILKGAAGAGVSFRLTNIDILPYTENKLTINKIDDNGVYFTFEKQKVNLKIGDEWQTSTTQIDTIKMNKPSIIKTKSTYTVRYFGKLSKKLIIGLDNK